MGLFFLGSKKLIASADNMRCVHNLRTIGHQSLAFFAENNGNLMPVWNWQAYEPFLQYLEIKSPYVGVNSYRDTLLTCPAFRRDKNYSKSFPSALNRCYSLNRWAHQYDVVQMQRDKKNVPVFPGNMANIAAPSKMFMFMEGCYNGFVATYYNISSQGLSVYELILGRPHESGTKGNAVFFDGHVESVVPENLDQPQKSGFWTGAL